MNSKLFYSYLKLVLPLGLCVIAPVFVINAKANHDEELEKLLASPSVVDQWQVKKLETKPTQPSIQELPLVQQAKRFGQMCTERYSAQMHGSTDVGAKQVITKKRISKLPAPKPRKVSPNFRLLATSYYSANPSKSLALVEETGCGKRWIKAGTCLGYVTIFEIGNGTVVYHDGETYHTIAKTKDNKGTSYPQPGRQQAVGPKDTYAKSGANIPISP